VYFTSTAVSHQFRPILSGLLIFTSIVSTIAACIAACFQVDKGPSATSARSLTNFTRTRCCRALFRSAPSSQILYVAGSTAKQRNIAAGKRHCTGTSKCSWHRSRACASTSRRIRQRVLALREGRAFYLHETRPDSFVSAEHASTGLTSIRKIAALFGCTRRNKLGDKLVKIRMTIHA
jgi:hypothetical protein